MEIITYEQVLAEYNYEKYVLQDSRELEQWINEEYMQVYDKQLDCVGYSKLPF